MLSPEWEIPGVESGKLPTRQQRVLSPEHRAHELCSRGFLGKDRDGLWWVRTMKQATHNRHAPASFLLPGSEELAAAVSNRDVVDKEYLQMA